MSTADPARVRFLEAFLSEIAALRTLEAAAGALVAGAALDATLQAILEPLVQLARAGSAAIFIRDAEAGGLEIAASVGLDGPAAAALQAAVANPAHPVSRTAADGIAAFDVRPMAPGGPALRVPISRSGSARVVGTA